MSPSFLEIPTGAPLDSPYAAKPPIANQQNNTSANTIVSDIQLTELEGTCARAVETGTLAEMREPTKGFAQSIRDYLFSKSPNTAGMTAEKVVDAWVKQGGSAEHKDRAYVKKMLLRAGVTLTAEGQLVVPGKLNFARLENLTTLPEKLTVGGNLSLRDCVNLQKLPKNLTVLGGLDLNNCKSLEEIPECLRVGGGLNLRCCTGLTKLPSTWLIGGNLYFSDRPSINKVPEYLDQGRGIENYHVGGDVDLRGCSYLDNLPDALLVQGDARIEEVNNIVALPKQFSVGRDLSILKCISLMTLSNTLSLGGNMRLKGCIGIKSLPDSFLALGPRGDGGNRKIDVANNCFSAEFIQKLTGTHFTGMDIISD